MKQCVVFLIGLLLLRSMDGFGQKDSKDFLQGNSASVWVKCLNFCNEHNWDSAFYYARIFDTVTKKEYGEFSRQHANSLYVLGELYRNTDNYSAYQFFKLAYETYLKIDMDKNYPNDATYAYTICRLGIISSNFGALTEAEPYLKKGIELFKTWKFEDDGLLQMNVCLADSYQAEGNYITVDSIYTSFKEGLDTLPANPLVHFELASIYNNMGDLYSHIGNLAKSIAYLKKALSFEKMAKEEGYVNNEFIEVLFNLAESYSWINQEDSASILCKQAEDSLKADTSLLKAAKTEPFYADKRNLLIAHLLKEKAFLCQQEQKFEQAIFLYKAYNKAIDSVLVKGDDYEANITNLATCYTYAKQNAAADSLFRVQIGLLHNAGLDYSDAMQQSEVAFCANLMDMKRYDEATDSLIALCRLTFKAMNRNFYGMAEADKLKYEQGLDEIFDLLYVCLYNNKATDKNRLSQIYALELQRKGLVLNSQADVLRKARASHDSSFAKVYNEWLNTRQMLAQQYSLPLSARQLNTDSMEEISENLEKKVSSQSHLTDIDGNGQPATTGLKEKHAGSANIEFIRFDHKAGSTTLPSSVFYAAFILRPGDSVPVFVRLCREKDLLHILKGEDEDQLTKEIYDKAGVSTAKFYSLVWQPLEKYLVGVKEINYATSGLLNNIAFQALYDGNNYLNSRYYLRRFFNLTDAGSAADAYAQPKAISIWGNINYNQTAYLKPGGGMNQAPTEAVIVKAVATSKDFTREPLESFKTHEPQKLKAIFQNSNIPVSSYEESNASEDNFKYYASATSGVLHISTHGFYFPFDKSKTTDISPANYISGIESPLFRCGLAFSGVNNYWMKKKVAVNHEDGILTGYEIAQLDLHNVQLVTLSACETGLGDVTDNEGNLGLQRAFRLAGVHNMLLTLWQVPAKQTEELLALFYTNWLSGQTMSKALQNAEKLMGKKYAPYYWAGFVLIE